MVVYYYYYVKQDKPIVFMLSERDIDMFVVIMLLLMYLTEGQMLCNKR